MPLPPRETIAASETAMLSGATRSAAMTALRLQRRYADIDFEHCIMELCYFLRNNGDRNDKFDKYRVAERALYPNFGAVGLNRDNTLQKALYYWLAANDQSPDMISSVEDRQKCFVRALYECQRGNNALDAQDNSGNSANINFVDNRLDVDFTVCQWGVNSKLPEVFIGMHPDIELIIDIKDRILDLVKAFIAEYLYSQGKKSKDLKSPELNLPELLSERTRESIKAKIIETLGSAGDMYEGFLTRTELDYLDDVLEEHLQYLDYSNIKSNKMDAAEKESELEINMQNYIRDARNQLADSRALRSQRRTSTPNTINPNISQFNLIRIQNIIIEILPEPTNEAFVHNYGGFIRIPLEGARHTPEIRQPHANPQTPRPRWQDPFQDFFNLTPQTYTLNYRRYTEQQLAASMSPAPTISAADADVRRLQRLVAMGLAPNR